MSCGAGERHSGLICPLLELLIKRASRPLLLAIKYAPLYKSHEVNHQRSIDDSRLACRDEKPNKCSSSWLLLPWQYGGHKYTRLPHEVNMFTCAPSFRHFNIDLINLYNAEAVAALFIW